MIIKFERRSRFLETHKKWSEEVLMVDGYHGSVPKFTLEQLYQAFKERLLEEIKDDRNE